MSNVLTADSFFTPPILAPSTYIPLDFLGKEVADGHSQVLVPAGAALVESQTRLGM